MYKTKQYRLENGIKHNDHIYKIWKGMVDRCYNPNHKDYARYGGRGIDIDESWLNFETFDREMRCSYKKGLTLERLDNNKGYSKHNCVWESRKTQARNRSTNNLITNPVSMETKTISEWAELFNINERTVRSRFGRGYREFSLLFSSKSLKAHAKTLKTK